MSSYLAKIRWENDGGDFINRKYSRKHEWSFDGGTSVAASSSPHVVPVPYSDESAVDPEEAFVAAVSSCHMLFFLDYASREKINVVSYVDEAVGVMEKNSQGKIAMTKVTLNPKVEYLGDEPGKEQIEDLHHRAHESCFIANSIKTEIEVTTKRKST